MIFKNMCDILSTGKYYLPVLVQAEVLLNIHFFCHVIFISSLSESYKSN